MTFYTEDLYNNELKREIKELIITNIKELVNIMYSVTCVTVSIQSPEDYSDVLKSLFGNCTIDNDRSLPIYYWVDAYDSTISRPFIEKYYLSRKDFGLLEF